MSDDVVVPVVEETVTPTVEVTPDAPTTAVDADSPVVGEEGKKPEAPKEAKTFTQDELDRIVAKEKAKAGRRAEKDLQREIDRKVDEALARGKPAAEPAVEAARPNRAAYASDDDYVEAIADWKADQKFTAREKAAEQQRKAEHQRQYIQGVEATFAEREDAARDKYDDYDEVTRSDHVPITSAMADTIKLMEKGPDVAYYLGSPAGLEDARQIAKLHPLKQAQALGRIEDKLASAPAPAKPTSAPDPISPISRAGGTVALDTSDPKSLEKLGTSGWIEAENRRMRESLKRAQG